jgi:RNA polymerase sigma-70 factor (ECF subfamily)
MLSDEGGATFIELVRLELPGAYRLAGYLLGDASEAEGAAREAIVKAWESWPRLRDTDSFPASFGRIVVNVCRDRLRNRRRGRVREMDESSALNADAQDPFRDALARDAVGRLVRTLPPDQQLVVALRFWRDLPLEDIAASLDMPLGIVESRLRHAMRLLRDHHTAGSVVKSVDDPDLERRLRRIAEDPEPPMPGRLYWFVAAVPGDAAAGATGSGVVGRDSVGPMRRRRWRPRRSRVIAVGAVAALLVAVIAAGTLRHDIRPASTPSVPLPSAPPLQWTGLNWHDVTSQADGLFAGGPGARSFGGVVTWSGGLVAYALDGVWTSPDGQSWKHVAGSPALYMLGEVGGKLVGLGFVPPTACPAAVPWVGGCSQVGGVWTSDDAVNWRSVSASFDGAVIVSLVTGPNSAIVVAYPAMAPNSMYFYQGPATIFATGDGVSWNRATVPDDLATSIGGLSASTFGKGYLVSGSVADPSGSGLTTDDLGNMTTVSVRHWSSPDGLTWSPFEPQPADQPLWGQIYAGRLGYVAGSLGSHSSDGINWTPDTPDFFGTLSGGGGYQVLGDGQRVLVSLGWNPTFEVGFGDGHWQALDQGGDIGTLPGGGETYLLPDGLLYATGGRVFFGQALYGVPVMGSLVPDVTPIPPPDSTPILIPLEPSP